jgi:hypothetical protein
MQLFLPNDLEMILLHVVGVQGRDEHLDLASVTGASEQASLLEGSSDHAGVVAVG